MKIFRRLLLILTLCGLTGISVLQAETCTDITIPPSNPTYLLSASNDGTVTDTRSGLMWKQCAEGFIWSGNTCNATGNIGTPMSWSAALQLAASTSFPPTLLPFPYADWRLPNIKELSTLVELCRSNSAINDSVFPNTQNGLFWSSSPSLDSPGVAWMVNFADGSVNNDYRASSNLVRLVRGGGGYANFDLGHTQTLTFGPAPTLLLGGTGTVSATGGACPPVIFTSLTPAICTSTASGLVTGKALGTCIIAANQAACGVYTAAPQVTQSFPVAAVPLYILNVAALGVPIPNVLIQASPTLYGGTTPYNKSSIASGTVITLTAPQAAGSAVFAGWSGCPGASGPGIFTCIITLNATTNIAASYKTIQYITFDPAPTILLGGTGTVSAKASSGLPVTFTNQTPAICTIDAAGVVTGLAVGNCIIAADQAGNSAFNAATTATQTIPISPEPTYTLSVMSSGASSVAITGSASSYAGTTPYNISNIASSTSITLIAPPTAGGSVFTGWNGCTTPFAPTIYQCSLTVSASSKVTANYKALISQAISFIPPIGVKVGGTGFLSATAYPSGFAATFGPGSSPPPGSDLPPTPSICTVSGSTVTGLAVGLCCVTADRPGDSTYSAAPSVQQCFNILPPAGAVAPNPPTISTITVVRGGAQIVLIAPTITGGSPLGPYTATCKDPSQKGQTVSGAGLTLTVSGFKSKVLYTCTATASNTYYSSAPSAAKTVTSLGGGVSLAPILMLLLD